MIFNSKLLVYQRVMCLISEDAGSTDASSLGPLFSGAHSFNWSAGEKVSCLWNSLEMLKMRATSSCKSIAMIYVPSGELT